MQPFLSNTVGLSSLRIPTYEDVDNVHTLQNDTVFVKRQKVLEVRCLCVYVVYCPKRYIQQTYDNHTSRS